MKYSGLGVRGPWVRQLEISWKKEIPSYPSYLGRQDLLEVVAAEALKRLSELPQALVSPVYRNLTRPGPPKR